MEPEDHWKGSERCEDGSAEKCVRNAVRAAEELKAAGSAVPCSTEGATWEQVQLLCQGGLGGNRVHGSTSVCRARRSRSTSGIAAARSQLRSVLQLEYGEYANGPRGEAVMTVVAGRIFMPKEIGCRLRFGSQF